MRKETRCHHIVYSFRLAARVLLYTPSHRQDNTYHSLERKIAQWVHPMKDRSDDPSHHEQTLYRGGARCSSLVRWILYEHPVVNPVTSNDYYLQCTHLKIFYPVTWYESGNKMLLRGKNVRSWLGLSKTFPSFQYCITFKKCKHIASFILLSLLTRCEKLFEIAWHIYLFIYQI